MKTVSIAALLLSSAAFADDPSSKKSEPASQERSVTFELRPYVNYTFDADLKSGGGQTNVLRGGSKFDLGIPCGQRGTLGLAFGAEFSQYNFSDATGFGAGNPDPIDGTYEYEFSATYSREMNDHWSFFAVAGVNASGEHGADFGDSLTYGGGGGISYKVNDNFSIGAGLIVRSRLEDDADFIPIPTINWQISEQWNFSTRYTGGRLTYAPCDQWRIFLGAEFATHEYRLDDDAGAPDGVFRDRAIPISLGATFIPSKNFSITAGGGVNVWRELTLDDKDGNRIARSKTDASFGIFLNAAISF